MESHVIIEYIFYIASFLLGTALLQVASKKFAFPYTVALLIVGFFSQFLIHFLHIPIHLSLSPDFIYFILLPILLFEAAIQINIHQFKIQFKTITFLATFGLLLAVFSVGFGLSWLIGLPFEIALLFGTIIAATDPIAVLSLFRTLGAPKRLALIADGESMFNDATAVIAFRIVSGFVVGHELISSQTFFTTGGNFLYVFLGSISLGILLGYGFSVFLQRIKTEQVLVSSVITAMALGSFATAEHFFHVSGVMTTVIAGVVFGNLARGKITSTVTHFVKEYFEYIGFISLSLVFFFASFTLDLGLFSRELPILLIVIAVVLASRSISVYLTVFLSNHLPIFRDEPNIPLSWQHILNWGGLRGVIPLVLVYSLPDSFVYKEMMLRFTFATLMFTLFVNGLTIKKLLTSLKLHIRAKEEKIVQDEMKLFALEESHNKLHNLSNREFTPSVLQLFDNGLFYEERQYKRQLFLLSNVDELLKSVKLQAIEIERKTLRKLFDKGRFNEGVLYEFESELDLQQDILEYPSLYKTRGINKVGDLVTRLSFRKRLSIFRKSIAKHTFLSRLFGIKEEEIVSERYSLLRARLFTSYAVLSYIDRIEGIFFHKPKMLKAIKTVRKLQERYIARNRKEIQQLSIHYPHVIIAYQKRVIIQLIEWEGKIDFDKK